MFQIPELVNKDGELIEIPLTYATKWSCGFDIPTSEEMLIEPMERVMIPTGLFLQDITSKIEPYSNYEYHAIQQIPRLEIVPKSGKAFKMGLTIINTPGTIEIDYVFPKEIKVLAINLSKDQIFIDPNDEKRKWIAQGVWSTALRPTLNKTLKIEDVVRDGGMGSTKG